MFTSEANKVLKECSLYRDSDFKAYFGISDESLLLAAKIYCRQLILEKFVEKRKVIGSRGSLEQVVSQKVYNAVLDDMSAILKAVECFIKSRFPDLAIGFKPSRGDLLFGLSEVINTYLELISGNSTDFKSLDAERFSWYLAGIEKGTYDSLSQAYSYTDVDTSQLSVSDTSMRSDDSCLSSPCLSQRFQASDWLKYYRQMIYGNYGRVSIGQQKRYELFLYHLEGSKYNPDKALTSLPDSEKLAREGNNLDMQQQKTLYAMRLACKFGIDFIRILGELSCKEDSAKPKVHYLLDNINLELVTSHSKVDIGDRGCFLPVVTSELKHIYKHWQELKNTVVFYLNGNIVPAPWEPCPEKWKNLDNTVRKPLKFNI